MNNLIDACHESLNTRGMVTRSVDIRRAYWRHAKQRNGINIGLDNQVYLITEYLIINNQAKKAYKYQKWNINQTAALQPSPCNQQTDTENVPTVARIAPRLLARI